MKIIEYFSCSPDRQVHWLNEINECDWNAGKTLHDLLKQGKLRTERCIGEDARLYLITEGDILCGFCTLSANDDIPDTKLTPWVGFVYIFPKWRGQHLFGSLLAHAIEQARTDGYGSIYISTDHTGLYEKYGAVFKEEARDNRGCDSRIYQLDFGWMPSDQSDKNALTKTSDVTDLQAGFPSRTKAERILEASVLLNPGPWREHSYMVAEAAQRIAIACNKASSDHIDPELAYICGLLHDIGRRFGKGHLRHVYDGWHFMNCLGYPKAAKVCLTHSFKLQRLDDYVGNHDLTDKEEREILMALTVCQYDDIDLLIQLCDSICGTEVMNIEDCMLDVKRRYGGFYPQDKWDANIRLLHSFEQRTGKDIYRIARG